ncbi:uncharacterized protein LOC119682346 [Teleopsis dalmanni]|uniref:uncharacterized protein LOC119682346 n=1 Tax=Teleopsis dalmanni TaxID=139649 RepID=UPI0018CF1D11|nr:uncharacterized protein LOC119682346 [Teleopsis dalmanni]
MIIFIVISFVLMFLLHTLFGCLQRFFKNPVTTEKLQVNSESCKSIKKVQFSNENFTVENSNCENLKNLSIDYNSNHNGNMSNDTAERPSFLVGDDNDATNGFDAREAIDEFPPQIQNETRPNGDLLERRKRLRYVVN